MTVKPHFQHDCTRCTFIASAHVLFRVVDIYRSCADVDSYIMRYSDAGDDYATVHEPRGPYSSTADGQPLLSLNYRLCQLAEELSAPQPQPLNLDILTHLSAHLLSYELQDDPGYEHEEYVLNLDEARAHLRGKSDMVVWASLSDIHGNVVAGTEDLV